MKSFNGHHDRQYLDVTTFTNFNSFRINRILLDSKEIQLDPREWGWQCKNGQNLSPITTDRCNRKEPANQCGTNRCSCRKNGLPCYITCGKYHGEEGENKQVRNIFYDIVINV